MKKIASLIFIFLLIGCQSKKSNWQPSVIKGMATPIYLKQQQDTIFLSDYFLDTSVIDSVKTHKSSSVKLISENKKAVIKVSKTTPDVTNLRVYTNGVANDIPVFKSNKKQVTIAIPDSNKQYKTVKVKGEFSNWQLLPLTFKDSLWEYTTYVYPGNHQYVLEIDGVEQPDPTNTNQVSNGMGGINSVLAIETYQDSVPFVSTSTFTEKAFTLTSTNPINTALVYSDNVLVDSFFDENGTTSITINIPNNTAKRSHIRVYTANKFGRGNDVLIPLEEGKIITDATKLTRTDFHTQVMYFLMVDRFKDGNPSNTKKVQNDSIHPKANYYGGDLEGVLLKIKEGYFTELGINTIWLSPITQNPEGAYGLWPDPLTKFSGYHGYWPISNTKIDYRFGNEDVFRELIQEAHKRNINVILDYVANHVHEEHPLYKKHPEWATNLYLPDGTLNTEKWDEHRLTTWFDTFMPTLDFSKPEVVEKMTDSAAYWVTNYNLDGFRHDATKHIQLEFWRTLTKKIKQRTNRPIFQIGETYGSPDLIRSYVNTGMLDAQFDFNLYDAAVQAFAKNETGFQHLAATLQKSLQYYGYHHLMGNISGNQDRARFISYASGDVRFDEDAKKAGWTRKIGMSDTTAYNKLAMLQAFNMAIPGIPCIYYGDEYGSIGGNDPDNRKMMRFTGLNKHEQQLKQKVANLVKTRRNSMALQYGSTKIVEASDKALIIKRTYFNEQATLIINTSDKELIFEGVTVKPNDFELVIKK